MNLLPAPRVIVPGPATRFPVLFVPESGSPVPVHSLHEAARISGERGFFCQDLPVRETIRVPIYYSQETCVAWAEGDAETIDTIGEDKKTLAARAAYCLNMDAATVTLGLGPGGPWILDVEEIDEPVTGRNASAQSAPEHLSYPSLEGAMAEYARFDPETGEPGPLYHAVRVDSGSRQTGSEPYIVFPDDLHSSTELWVASPCPVPEMPLSTRLVFRGKPYAWFMHLLDYYLGVLAMLVSPSCEVRQRNACGQGLLGNIRVANREPAGHYWANAGEEAHEGFEYLVVPTLLQKPDVLLGMVQLAELVSSGRLAMRRLSLWETYRLTSGYYNADKKEFADYVAGLREDISLACGGVVPRFIDKLLQQADMEIRDCAGPRGEEPALDPLFLDFREAYGIAVRRTESAAVFVAPGDGCRVAASAAGEGAAELSECTLATVRAGSRFAKARIMSDDLLFDAYHIETSGIYTSSSYTSIRRSRYDSWLPDESPAVLVRPGLFLSRELSLFPRREYLAFVAGRGSNWSELRIGPVVGIMSKERGSGDLFGVETDMFRRIILLAHSMGILAYVFFPDKIDWDSGLILAWHYRERCGWFRALSPLPDVVYDRHIPDPASHETIDAVSDFLRRHPQVMFVNSRPFVDLCRDKLLSHNLLASSELTRSHVPRTIPGHDPGVVANFAAGNRRTFLKLRNGTGSRNLIVVDRVDAECARPGEDAARSGERGTGCREPVFSVVANWGEPPAEEIRVRGTEGLSQLLGELMGSGGSALEWIAQEGINLAVLPDCGSVFEVRVVYHKGGAGRWLRTGMVCRVNPGNERFIVPRKERHMKVDDVLERVFPGRSLRVRQELREVADVVPGLLESASGYGGEVSVDLGIDIAGKPWIIEVNSRPATLFRDIGAFRIREISHTRILNWAKLLFSTSVARAGSQARDKEDNLTEAAQIGGSGGADGGRKAEAGPSPGPGHT